GVEDQMDAVRSGLFDRRLGQLSEDALAMEVGMRGGVDRPHTSNRLALWSQQLPAHERSNAGEASTALGYQDDGLTERVVHVLPVPQGLRPPQTGRLAQRRTQHVEDLREIRRRGGTDVEAQSPCLMRSGDTCAEQPRR